MTQEANGAALRWKIDKDIELYRFYLDMSVKAAVFLMAVTGAIASYVLSNVGSRIVTMALIFPALMNAAFSVLFFYSIKQAQRLADLHRAACAELGVPEYNTNPLRSVCQIFCLMCALATVGLVLLVTLYWLGVGSVTPATRPPSLY